jgi:colanic acid/amylovoran biosynthesis glycosyltransferase
MLNTIILHSIPNWLPQTQTWVHSQVDSMQKIGVNAHVACEATSNLDQFQVDNIHCLRHENLIKRICYKLVNVLNLYSYINYTAEVAKKTKANIVHSHFADVGWKNTILLDGLSLKHIVTFYGYDVNYLPNHEPIWKQRYLDLFKLADLFLCEGSHMAKCIVDLGCPQEKVMVQHLGVDVNKFEFKPRVWDKTTPLKILIAASFREKKGIPYAIEALGILSKTVRLEITIIGDAGNDEAGLAEKTKILDLIKTFNLESVTQILGYQPHEVLLKKAYQHHIFLHPSVTAANGDTEGGAPVSIIEMMATGMLVVSTKHCDIPEVFGDRLQHLLTEEKNVAGLVSILQALIDNSANWDEIIMLARKRVVSEYSIATQTHKLKIIYEKLHSN